MKMKTFQIALNNSKIYFEYFNASIKYYYAKSVVIKKYDIEVIF